MATPLLVENLVLGGGESGKYIAWELAKQGRQVVVVERALIGGSCPNIACLPSKNVIQSARVAHRVRNAEKYGLDVATPNVSMTGVRQRKRDMVDGLVDMHRQKFAVPGIEFLFGTGRLVGPRRVEVTSDQGEIRQFEFQRLFLNLGTHATVPDIPGLVNATPMTHVEALELDEVPAHVVVLGGGYVGVELAQALRRFGSEVTILQSGTQLLDREEPEVAQAVQALLESEGIKVLLETKAQAVEGRSGERVCITAHTPRGVRTVEGSHILVAAGRTPNTKGIGLEEAGIALDARGFIAVDDHLRTTATDVWAMGECAGSPQFTHIAFDDFRVVRDALAGKPRPTTGRLVPYCCFLDPELARIGLDEATARRQGTAVDVLRIPMASVLRARALGETTGFMKAVVAKDSGKILGFTMLGPRAGEVMAVVQVAMMAGLPATALREAILTHPTMAEGLNVLFSSPPQSR